MVKTNLILISFIIILLSCGQRGKNSQINIHQDSLAQAAKEKQRQDSLRKDSFIEAEQDKAIGDIHFFISQKQFNNDQQAFIKKCKLPKDEFYESAIIIEYKIGNYGFTTVDGWFHKDSLYQIEIGGCPIDYDEYDRVMIQQYLALMDVLKSKYGEPNTDNGFPSWSSIDKGFFKRCAIWEIGSKTIEVRILCNGTDYQLNLTVFKPAIEELVSKEEENKSKDETEKGKSVL